jgi:hypothetical protein
MVNSLRIDIRMTVGNEYQPIMDLYQEACTAQDAGALVAALSMVFVGIDTMAWLSLPASQLDVKRDDFCRWVNAYLKAESQQPYQYVGIDLYAARCAILHHYGTRAALHAGANPPKEFGYMDNGPHRTDGSNMVLISIAVLVHDFGRAIGNFLEVALKDAALKALIDGRMRKLVNTMTVMPASVP